MRHLLAAAVLAIASFACSTGSEGSADTVSVAIKDFAFLPAETEVERGGTVEWTSGDEVLHTVTSGTTTGPENSADGIFDGKLPDSGSTFSHTFEEAGTFTYFCAQHNVMNGTVIVR